MRGEGEFKKVRTQWYLLTRDGNRVGPELPQGFWSEGLEQNP